MFLILFKNIFLKKINYRDTCQLLISADVTFRQILDKILTKIPSLSLDKPEMPLVTKSKPGDKK